MFSRRLQATRLRVLADLVRDKDVVDLRPTMDTAPCLATSTRSVLALVHSNNESDCEALNRHAANHHSINNFTALWPRDYHLVNDLPDGDAFLWWQQLKFWTNAANLELLRHRVSSGLIRPRAQAIVMFDLTQWRDSGDWQKMKPNATWWHETAFDERALCAATAPERHRALCESRACGTWLVASFDLDTAADRVPSNEVPHTDSHHGAFGVAGHAEEAPKCKENP